MDLNDSGARLSADQMGVLHRMYLGTSITDALKRSGPSDIRRWYVDTFVLDPNNLSVLKAMGSHPALEKAHDLMDWRSIEHAAIGHRLLFEIKPQLIAPDPKILEPDNWRNEQDVTDAIVRLVRPWDHVRYDPEGENWYTAVSPGQWVRHGKGDPSDNTAEAWIAKWLRQIDLVDGADLYVNFMPDTSTFDADTLLNKQNGARDAFRKFRVAPQTLSRIRRVMERMSIMHLDTRTLNMMRSIAPFANGALTLVGTERVDTTGTSHTIPMGTLLPLDKEYMVTNANPLPWLDTQGEIPKAASDYMAQEGDFISLDWRQLDLLTRECPTYNSFLNHAFPDAEERSAFLRLLGAAMYGSNLKIVAAMIGEPNAGKDTVVNWLSYLMPGQVATLPFSAFTPHGDDDRGFAPLLGARVATVSGEVGEGRGSKLLAEKIKTVSSGGGKIRVAEKYEKPTDIWFDGMLFLQGNSVPQIAGGDRALYTNRLVAVEFKHPFPLVSRSYEAEYREEAPYFAQVLFINYIQYLFSGGGMAGIDPPETWRAFAKEFADASNQHGWLESSIVPSTKGVPTTQFHQALSAMVQRFGSPFPVGPNYWPKRLRTLGFPTTGDNSVRKQVMQNGQRVWHYFLTLDAERSDGAFTQQQWENILKDAAVTV